MAKQKPNKKEKFAAAAQAKSAASSGLVASQVPDWWPFLPLILGAFAYLNTLNHGFALDDYAAIIENVSTRKGWAAIGEIFSTSYRYGYILISDNLYRPFTKAIFAAFWGAWPESAFPGHLLNISLFAFTCYYIYRIIAKWWPEHILVALLTSCLFALHPIHTEVVANIKSLDEILSFLFCLISLDFFVAFSGDGKFKTLVVSIVCFFLALLCKESAITFLVLFPLMAWFIQGKGLKFSLKGFAIMLVPALLFLLIRYQILTAYNSFESAPPSVADNMLSSAKDPLTRFSGAVAMLGLYLWKLILPVHLSFDLSYPEVVPSKVTDLSFIISALVLSGLLAAGLSGMKKRSLLSAALLLFFVTVSVSSNIFMLIGTHYGERLLYAPSFGFCLAVSIVLIGYLGDETNKSQIALRLAVPAIVILLFYGFQTISRNPVWKDNSTLYASGLISAPNSARVHYYQGLLLVKPETIALFPPQSQDSVVNAGISHLRKSAELYPAFSDTWTQLGVAYYRKKDFKEAVRNYEQALKYNKFDPVVYNNLGSVYFDMQRYNDALNRYMEAVRLKPDYADAFMNIGSCYGVAGKYDEAINYFQKALSFNPELAQAYYMIAVTYKNQGNETMADQYFKKAEALKSPK